MEHISGDLSLHPASERETTTSTEIAAWSMHFQWYNDYCTLFGPGGRWVGQADLADLATPLCGRLRWLPMDEGPLRMRCKRRGMRAESP